jgi:hypothetical protein
LPATSTPAFRILAPDGSTAFEYAPTPKQQEFHACAEPNVLYVGSRGTGKSLALRMDAHMRALAYPGFRYAIIRDSYPNLLKSHLTYIEGEMRAFGGTYNKTDRIAKYPNGSIGFFSHCADDAELGNLLSAELYWLGFDEWSTLDWETSRKLAASVRVPKGSGLIAMIRGATNPVGPSAEQLKRYFIDKDVDPYGDPDYLPGEWRAVETILADNPHIDTEQYRKMTVGLPEHIRRAWLHGEWVEEGTYFSTFRRTTEDGKPWHVLEELPSLQGGAIYAAMDWGWNEPTVLLMVAVLPNGRTVVFKEREWTHTTARDVAAAMKREFAGFRVRRVWADPTMFNNSAATDFYSVGDVIRSCGIPLEPSRNDRIAAGYAISEALNTILPDGLPKLQIHKSCERLIKTLPAMRMDPKNPERIADGDDHHVISLSYALVGGVHPLQQMARASVPFWMRPTRANRWRPGQESVKRR